MGFILLLEPRLLKLGTQENRRLETPSLLNEALHLKPFNSYLLTNAQLEFGFPQESFEGARIAYPTAPGRQSLALVPDPQLFTESKR